jgi:putative Mn2+ efflux pump MntP
MGLLNIVIVSVALAMDASSVGLSLSSSGYLKSNRSVFRVVFHFGLFQFAMPVIGWAAGKQFVRYFENIDHWIAFGLLLFVGAKMIKSGKNGNPQNKIGDPSKGVSLVLLSLATSIDALAVGLSLAMLNIGIWYPSLMIGAITALMTFVFIVLGRYLGDFFGNKMEILGGFILIAIGTQILLSHLGII